MTCKGVRPKQPIQFKRNFWVEVVTCLIVLMPTTTRQNPLPLKAQCRGFIPLTGTPSERPEKCCKCPFPYHESCLPKPFNKQRQKRAGLDKAKQEPFSLHLPSRVPDLRLSPRRPNMRVMHLPPIVSSPSLNESWVLRYLTFVANFRLVSVSLRCAWSGLTITNMSVFELPPRENWRRYVNCGSR